MSRRKARTFGNKKFAARRNAEIRIERFLNKIEETEEFFDFSFI